MCMNLDQIASDPTSLTEQIVKYQTKLTPRARRSKFVCIINTRGQRVCYNDQYPNKIQCDSEKCRINYKTFDHSILSKDIPEGIWTNIYDNGQLSSIQLIGTIPKQILPEVKKEFPDVPVSTVKSIGDPYLGIPKKPIKCKVLFWKKECKNYDF